MGIKELEEFHRWVGWGRDSGDMAEKNLVRQDYFRGNDVALQNFRLAWGVLGYLEGAGWPREPVSPWVFSDFLVHWQHFHWFPPKSRTPDHQLKGLGEVDRIVTEIAEWCSRIEPEEEEYDYDEDGIERPTADILERLVGEAESVLHQAFDSGDFKKVKHLLWDLRELEQNGPAFFNRRRIYTHRIAARKLELAAYNATLGKSP